MSAAPWRLPPPPGMHAQATSMKAVAANATALPSEDDSPVFSFQRRTMQLNWNALLHLDLNAIIQTVDLSALHSQLESLTFADIGEGDLAYFTDSNFLHLFRLAQLVLEYTLFAWKASTVSANLRDKKYATLKAHCAKLKDKLEAERADNKHLRKEIKYCKHLIAALEGGAEQKHTIHAPIHAPLHAHAHHPLGGSVGRHPPRGHLAHHPVHQAAAPSQLQPHVPLPLQPQPALVEEAKEQEQFDPVAQAREQAAREREKAQLVQQLHQQAASDAQHSATKVQEEIDAENARLDNLQSSIRQLMAAQAEDVQQQENRTPRVGTAEATSAPALTPSQAAQQKLLGNMLHEVAQLRRTKSIHEPDVGIELFNPTTAPAPLVISPIASPQQQPNNSSATSASLRSSQIYNFEPVSTVTQQPAAAPSPTPMPSPSQQIGLRPTARARPDYSPEQQAEIDKLSDWLRLVETEEVGAEIVKIQQEAALVAQAERALAEQAQAQRDELEVKKVEEAIPEDHPLLHDTILASPRPGVPVAVRKRSLIMTSPIHSPAARPTMPLPSPSPTAAAAAAVSAPAPVAVSASPPPPVSVDSVRSSVAASPAAPVSASNLTIEIMSPASMPLTKPLLVGNNLIAPPAPLLTLNRVPSNVSANARAPVLVPAPLADPMPPAQSVEEKAEALLSLSPNSRVRALEAEKSKIKLRAVITARTVAEGSDSVKQSLYAPFPSMPFLPSLYNHSPEELREAYDATYTWCDTAMRTEANAQELLTYAVQMDCTGELYAEVAARMDELAKHYVPGPEYHAATARIAAMEEENRIHEQEEYLRRLHEARWQQARVDSFERQWIAMQHREEDREYYLRLDEQMKHDKREQDFAKYLENLAGIERKLEALKAAERGHHLPPQTGTREQQPVSGPALIPVHHQRQIISATAAAIAVSPTATAARTPSAAAAAPAPVTAAPTSPARIGAQPRQFRSPHEPVAPVVQRPASAALRNISDDEDEDDEDIDFLRPQSGGGAPSQRGAQDIKSAFSERKEDVPVITQQSSRALQRDSDDDLDDDEDHNAAARQAIRAASTRPTSAMATAPSNQFSRPGPRTNNIAASNRTPDKPLTAQHPIARPTTSSGSSVRSGAGSFTRPKTSSGAALRSRFAANDSFEEEDEDDEEAAPLGEDSDPASGAQATSAAAPAPIPSAASLSRDDGPRTLNPRRAAGVNLGALGTGSLSSRPATAVTGGASFASAPADSAYDSDVSDVSSIVQLPEGVTRPGTSVGSAPAIVPPVPTASAAAASADLPLSQPALVSQLSTGSNSGILQGRGRPRNQPLKPSSAVAAPTPRPEAGEDSLSSLLGGGLLKRPASSSARSGLNSGPGGYRSKLQSAALRNDSDNDSSLDLDS